MQIAIDEVINGRERSRLQLAVLALMTAVLVLDGLDMQLLPYAAPLILTEWGVSKLALAPAMGGVMIGMALGTIVGGRLGDRLGRRWSLIGTATFFGLATLGCACVESPTELTALRIIGGLGFGASFPNATALVSEWMPRRQISQSVGTIIVGVPLGGMIGGALAIAVLPAWGWRASFVCGGLLALLLALVLLWLLPESPSWLAQRGRNDERIHALLKRAWATTVFSPGTSFVASTHTDAALVGSARIFTARNLRVNAGIWTAFFMNMLAAAALIAWSPVILTSLGLPLTGAIAGSIYFSCASIVGNLGCAFIAARFGTRATMLALVGVAALFALGLCGALFLGPSRLPNLISDVIAGATVVGGCLAGLQALLWVLAANAYSTEVRSTGVAVAATAGRLGAIASSTGAGALLSFLPATYFFASIAAALVLVGLAVMIVDRHVSAHPRIRLLERRL